MIRSTIGLLILLLVISGCSRTAVYKMTDYSSEIRYDHVVKTYLHDTLDIHNILIEYYNAENKLIEEISYCQKICTLYKLPDKNYRTKYLYDSTGHLLKCLTSIRLDSLDYQEYIYQYDLDGNLIGKCSALQPNCQTIYWEGGLKQKELVLDNEGESSWFTYEYDEEKMLKKSWQVQKSDTIEKQYFYSGSRLDSVKIHINCYEPVNAWETYVYNSENMLIGKIVKSNIVLEKDLAMSYYYCTYEFCYDQFGRKKMELIKNHRGQVWGHIYFIYETKGSFQFINATDKTNKIKGGF